MPTNRVGTGQNKILL